MIKASVRFLDVFVVKLAPISKSWLKALVPVSNLDEANMGWCSRPRWGAAYQGYCNWTTPIWTVGSFGLTSFGLPPIGLPTLDYPQLDNGGSPSPIGVSPNGVSPNGVSPNGGGPSCCCLVVFWSTFAPQLFLRSGAFVLAFSFLSLSLGPP